MDRDVRTDDVMADSTREPIACTLQGANYQDRLTWIADLNRDGLLSHERNDLVLDLRYAADVADRVRELVAREQECCGFLRFDCQRHASEVLVRITAPERARDVIDLLFEQFVPRVS